MAIQLGSAYGKVSLDVNGLKQGVASGKASLQTLALAGEQLGSALQSAGQKLTLGLTLPILATGAAAIKAASDYEETKNKAVVVFGEMADSVVDSSNKAATALGVSKKQYLDYASSIGAALTAGGMGIKEATELSEQAVKHFADLASFHNARVEDVAAAWQSAIRGQYEPIQRYFPFITDSYLKTYGIANGLVDANTSKLDANQRAIVLNAIALNNELNPALNDFAETAGGLANSTRIMQAQFNDALIMLGQNLLPIALQVVQALNSMLTAMNNMTPFQQKMVLGFLAFLAILGPVLSAVGTVISFISTLAGLFGGTTISVAGLSAALGTAGTALAAVGTFALTVIAPLLLIIATVYAVYWAFKNNFGGISTTVSQLWFLIKYYFGLMVNFLKNLRFADIGRYLIMGLINGMLGGIPSLIMVATKIAQAALDAIKRTLGIASPSKVMMQMGLQTAQGYMMGMNQGMDPNAIAQTLTKPVMNNSNSTTNRTTINLAGGISIHEADRLIDRKLNKMISKMNYAMG